MLKTNKTSKFGLMKMLWERKFFYICGFIITFFLVLINKFLGSKVNNSDFIVMPLACSFVFGFILYLVKNEPERLKKDGRSIVFSKEGLIHLGLTFSTIIISGTIINVLK